MYGVCQVREKVYLYVPFQIKVKLIAKDSILQPVYIHVYDRIFFKNNTHYSRYKRNIIYNVMCIITCIRKTDENMT